MFWQFLPCAAELLVLTVRAVFAGHKRLSLGWQKAVRNQGIQSQFCASIAHPVSPCSWKLKWSFTIGRSGLKYFEWGIHRSCSLNMLWLLGKGRLRERALKELGKDRSGTEESKYRYVLKIGSGICLELRGGIFPFLVWGFFPLYSVETPPNLRRTTCTFWHQTVWFLVS